MALDTYTDLLAEIQDWLMARADVATKAPTFVTMFEARVNRKLFVWQMEQRATATVDIGAAEPQYIELPSGFQSMRRIRITNGQPSPPLRYVTPAFIDDQLQEQAPGFVTQPTCFTLVAGALELYPLPDQSYQVSMTYRQFITPLATASGGVNWLLQTAPDLYLYGSLMAAAPYILEDERVPLWKAELQEAWDDLHKLDEKATYNAGPLVMRRGKRGY